MVYVGQLARRPTTAQHRIIRDTAYSTIYSMDYTTLTSIKAQTWIILPALHPQLHSRFALTMNQWKQNKDWWAARKQWCLQI